MKNNFVRIREKRGSVENPGNLEFPSCQLLAQRYRPPAICEFKFFSYYFLNRTKKKAAFFTIDAILGLAIIFGVLLLIRPSVSEIYSPQYVQADLLNSLSSVSIGDLNNSYAEYLRESTSKIDNPELSVLEQLGEFYALSDNDGELLAKNILENLSLRDSIGLYFNGDEIAIENSSSFDDAVEVWASRQLISGIQNGSSVTGFSSRAFLSSLNKQDYFYFGGYNGDGNLSLLLQGDILSVDIEAVFSGNFDLYVNDIFTEGHNPTIAVPYVFNLDDYMGNFIDGNNLIDIKSSEPLYVAGGFAKIVYNNSQNISAGYKHLLPGTREIINIYDSIYVPGNLKGLEIYFHYNSNFSTFITLGNQSVYNGTTGGVDDIVTISNNTLFNLLDFSSMSKKTIPLRIGMENVSYILNESIDADVFSVTDLSGSMAPGCSGSPGFWCCLTSGDFCGSEPTCNLCGGTWGDKLGQAKAANKLFVDVLLNYSDNMVGLVGYDQTAQESDYHQLSIDDVSLKAKVDSWTAGGSTCICCGINKAVDKITAQSPEENFRSFVVMSDGEANVQCALQGTGNAANDAIQAACDANDDHGIKIYAVGFGNDVDETTMQAIAACGEGSYYYGDIEDLLEIYQNIADEIINASYFEQTVIGEGINSTLYPDSYISISYDGEIPFGLSLSLETEEFGNDISEGSVFIQNDSTPYEVNVISYSGSKWTNLVEVYNSDLNVWEVIFNLSEYGRSYTSLGDPYIVNIPLDKIIQGNNTVRVSTGLGAGGNSTGGSTYNKILYTVIRNATGYSPIVASAEGCSWTVEFEDGTSGTIMVPQNYSGSDSCLYGPSGFVYNPNDAIEVATFLLLEALDLDSDGRVENKFSSEEVILSSSETTGIPFTWGSEVQVRVWR